ncbi:MAG: hypothetical protein ABI607_12640 [Betaproteobacteria bacterium]
MLSLVASVAYPFLVYWVLAQRQPWPGVLLMLVAMGALCACLPQRRMQVAGALGVVVVAGLAMAIAATPLLPFLPPLCVNLGLAWLFGHTLLPGQEPLLTRFARVEEGEPDAQVLAYTQRLTWLWTAFFLVMATVSATLATLAAHDAWVWFTAVGNYVCVAALFAIEYGYRRWRFPRKVHASPMRQVEMLRSALRSRER